MFLSDKYHALMAQSSSEKTILETAFSLLVCADAIDHDCKNRLQPYGLSEGGFAVLVILLMSEKHLQPSQIAEKMGVTRATMTGLLDTLEKKGYITRHYDKADRRCLFIGLSLQGRELAKKLKETHGQWLTQLCSVLDHDEQAILLRLLNKLYFATDKAKQHETV